MLVSEALLLLLLDEEKGSAVMSGWAHDEGLAGALLLDLLAANRIVEHDGKLVTLGSAPSSPALAAAWAAIEADRRSVRGWVSRLPRELKPIKRAIAEELVVAGVLDEQRHKRLGLFTTTRFPERDPGPEQALRASLRAVLVDGAEPDQFTTALLALLVPMDLVGRLVPRGSRSAAKARAKRLAEGDPVGDAVRKAVQREVNAAVIAATTAASSSSS